MDNLAFTTHNALTQWEFSPFALLVLVAVIAAAVWYVRAEWALAARGRRWSGKRMFSFLAGLVAIDIALQSPVASFTMSFFQAHMLQHLLLMVVGPPLLAMGAPMTLALQTSGRTTKVRLLKALHSRGFRILTHPGLVAFL
jgi:putative copper resistance protein D